VAHKGSTLRTTATRTHRWVFPHVASDVEASAPRQPGVGADHRANGPEIRKGATVPLTYHRERSLFTLSLLISLVFWLALLVGTAGALLLFLLLGWLFGLVAMSGFISHLRGNGVHISAAQYPELHQQLLDCCNRLGIKQAPEAYVLHEEGIFNALATRFLRRNYIVLYSRVLDALEGAPQAINFYIGHELGHIHRRHLIWRAVIAPSSVLPLLGPALRRAEEYTCDRYGLAACEKPAYALIGLAALAAGASRMRKFSPKGFEQQAAETGGFWMSYHELTNGYPWLCKRLSSITALAAQRPYAPPRRSLWAYPLALLTPHVPVAAGGGLGGLIVLVAGIGILAGIGVPAYQDYRLRATIAEGIAAARPLQDVIADQAASNGGVTHVQMAKPEKKTLSDQRFSVSIQQDRNGVLVLTYHGGTLDGDKIVLSPANAHATQWRCDAASLPRKLQPLKCRQEVTAAAEPATDEPASADLATPQAHTVDPDDLTRDDPPLSAAGDSAYWARAWIAEGISRAQGLKFAEAETWQAHGVLPTSMDELGRSEQHFTLDAGHGVSARISLDANGAIIITYDGGPFSANRVALIPEADGPALGWRCASRIDQNLLPVPCQ